MIPMERRGGSLLVIPRAIPLAIPLAIPSDNPSENPLGTPLDTHRSLERGRWRPAAGWRRTLRPFRSAAMAAETRYPRRCRSGYWRDVSHLALCRVPGATAVSTLGHSAAHHVDVPDTSWIPAGYCGALPRHYFGAGQMAWPARFLLRICSPRLRHAESAAFHCPCAPHIEKNNSK